MIQELRVSAGGKGGDGLLQGGLGHGSEAGAAGWVDAEGAEAEECDAPGLDGGVEESHVQEKAGHVPDHKLPG